jgi:magnesium transporter
VMHTVELAGDELGVGEVAVFAGPHYVLSVRSGSKHGLKDVRERCEREPELLKKGSGYVLYALMDAVVDRYFPVLDELETQLEAIEERIFADRSPRASLEALYDLKHKLMVLKHATAPLLEAASRLYAGRVPHVCTGLGEYFRDVCDHLVRLNQSIDTARDTIATAISVNLTMITIVDSEVTKRLAAYGALVAVPTLIAGVYGMNFVHMPELKVVLGYPISLAVMAILDGYLWYRFRKAGWL